MGAHKQAFCKEGHPLAETEVIHTKTGYRECRICRRKRCKQWKRDRRAELRRLDPKANLAGSLKLPDVCRT